MAFYQLPGTTQQQSSPWAPHDGTLAPILGTSPDVVGRSLLQSIFPQASQVNRGVLEPDVSFLFYSCFAPKPGLKEQDYVDAAKTLNVDVPSVKAVAEVETQGKAFDDYNRPRILFERHYFHRLTAGAFAAKHPVISQKTDGGYGKFSAQYGKLQEAYGLNQNAALMSASWGRFQIMGENFSAAGFASVKQFVMAMTRGEREHLLAFTNFVAAHPNLLTALRAGDWTKFASGYNGPKYKKNKYDEKMKAAHEKYVALAKGKP
ncbi:MAG: N-acetylmuramidase family protein [Casimicrobium sp.]